MKTLNPLTPEAVSPGEEIEMKGTMADAPAEPRSFSSALLPISGIIVQNFQRPPLALQPHLQVCSETEGRKDARLAQWVACFPL